MSKRLTVRLFTIVALLSSIVFIVFYFWNSQNNQSENAAINALLGKPLTSATLNSDPIEDTKKPRTKPKETSDKGLDDSNKMELASQALKTAMTKSADLDKKDWQPVNGKLAQEKRDLLDLYDSTYSATKPSTVTLDKDGQLKGIFPSYTSKVSDIRDYVNEITPLLDETGSDEFKQTKYRCIKDSCVATYQRLTYGYPVLNDNIVASALSMAVSSVQGNLTRPNVSKEVLDSNNTASEDQLLSAAKEYLNIEALKIDGHSTYGIFQQGAMAQPAYEIIVYESEFLGQKIGSHRLTLDSTSYKVLASESLTYNTNASGIDLTGNSYNFNAIPYLNGYAIQDERFPVGFQTRLWDANQTNTNATNNYEGTTPVISNELNSGWDASAVSALSHFVSLVSYFNTKFNYVVCYDCVDG